MRILVLGGTGMLGHKLVQRLSAQHDVWTTVRGSRQSFARYGLLNEDSILAGVDAADVDSLVRALAEARPHVAINCIGVIKQAAAAKDPIRCIGINALFPHRLAGLCRTAQCRLIHISTDCVFSGRKGTYCETDAADADDLYGKTKSLGEIVDTGSLTLRTSIIGRELSSSTGLVEWFLSRCPGTVPGYVRAYFSGLTTAALAGVVNTVVTAHPDLSGLYHVASERISKFNLLSALRERAGLQVYITPEDTVAVDRSLDGGRFITTTGIRIPTWQAMIDEMACDPTPYDHWRTTHAAS